MGTKTRDEIVADYEAAYLLANGKPTTVGLTNHDGWFIVLGTRTSRKQLLEATERLNNRAAGLGQMTNAELAAAAPSAA